MITCLEVCQFQFLIGTLKTLVLATALIVQFTFQFLIGTLKTRNTMPLKNFTYFVSIPHRYAKNFSARFLIRAERGSFNSS